MQLPDLHRSLMSKGPVALLQTIVPAALFVAWRRRTRLSIPQIAVMLTLMLIGVTWYAHVLAHVPHVGQRWKVELARSGLHGTAQVVAMKQGERYDEKRVREEHRDHALFIAFAPADEPRLAMALLVENGGHGGSTAAPIAAPRSTALTFSRNLPVMIRDRSSRSSTRSTCANALRSITSNARGILPGLMVPSRSIRAACSIASPFFQPSRK